jgi:hypothetical protein
MRNILILRTTYSSPTLKKKRESNIYLDYQILIKIIS